MRRDHRVHIRERRNNPKVRQLTAASFFEWGYWQTLVRGLVIITRKVWNLTKLSNSFRYWIENQQSGG